ncbi:DUF58 domain-containing protein [Paenibacillus enshidis]
MSSNRMMRKKSGRSGRIWLFGGVWLTCLLYVLFQGGKTSFMLLSMVTLLGVYLWIGGRSGVSRAKGVRYLSSGAEYSETLHAGDQIHVRLHLSIPGFLPLPYVIVREVLKRHTGESWSFEESIIPSIKGNGQLSFQTTPLERGRYYFADTEIITEDIFGLMENKGLVKAPGEFRVLPRVVFIPYWQLNNRKTRLAGPDSVLTRTRRETTQINGVRDYVYGDRLSRIHWNATAKTGSWKSKEFEHETVPKTMLVLDHLSAHYKSGDQFELAVSTTASLLEFGGRERMGIGLCTAGQRGKAIQPSENGMERQKMLHHLVDLDLDPAGDMMGSLESTIRLFPQGSFFVLVSPLADERALEIFRWADAKGMIPCHVHIGGSGRKGEQDQWMEVVRKRGIYAYSVSSLQELPTVMGGGM